MRADDEMGSGRVTSPRVRTCACLDCDERSCHQSEITFSHKAASCSFLPGRFLANERELTGKTFTMPLTSTNPNTCVLLNFVLSAQSTK